jgi:hypothetical protein
MIKTLFLVFLLTGAVLAQLTPAEQQSRDQERIRNKARQGADVECTDSIMQNYLKALDDTTLDNNETGGTTRSDALYGFCRICGHKNGTLVTQEILKRLLQDKHQDVRREAAALIPGIAKTDSDSIKGIAALRLSIHDYDVRVRLQAVTSLVRMHIIDTGDVLDTLINIAKGQATFPEKPIKGCVDCIKKTSQQLRLGAIKQLNHFKYKKADLALQNLSNDQDSLIKQAVLRMSPLQR